MEIPKDITERRLTHKWEAVCRIIVEFVGMVKVVVEDASPESPVRIWEKLQFVKRNWEQYSLVAKGYKLPIAP